MRVRVTIDGRDYDEAILPRHRGVRCGSTTHADVRVPHPDGQAQTVFLLHPATSTAFTLEPLVPLLLNGEAPTEPAFVEANDEIMVGGARVRFSDSSERGATMTELDAPPAARALELSLPDGRTVRLEPEQHTKATPLVIGRRPAASHDHVCVLRNDPVVSREHCHVFADGPYWVVASFAKHGTIAHDLLIPHGQHLALTRTSLRRPVILHCGKTPLQLRLVPDPWEFMPASAAMKAIYDRIDTELAYHKDTVLILGETGVGKTILARRIHDHSVGRDTAADKFVKSEHSEVGVEADLVGVKKGGYTGADGDRDGVFVRADGGTAFLDEIGDYNKTAQLRLLRACDEGVVTPIGATQDVAFDARIVAATWRDLKQEVAEGRFRTDLLARLLQVPPIRIPALRDRPEDIAPYAKSFLSKHDPDLALTSDALSVLHTHPWRTNLRELNAVLKASTRRALARGARDIDVGDVQAALHQLGDVEAAPPAPATRHHRRVPRAQIEAALRSTGGNVRRAAMEVLAVPDTTLRRWLHKLEIDPARFVD
ncbi:MAG: sigma 54-interacting transcriptional regulator [Deltaproteobacteria bacterium]|jgi:transcriptional regulator with AAA-type ATPase domain